MSYHPPEEFTGKYEETNPISRYLLDNFYRNLQSLIPADITSAHEVGCGAGYSVARLKTFFSPETTFTASDVDPVLVKMTTDMNPEITCTTESIYELPYEDNTFDIIFALETLEHLDDPMAALKELKRVSRKYVIISVPREPLWRVLNMARLKYVSDLGNTPGHLNHWSTRGIRRFIETEMHVEDYRTPLPWSMVLATVPN